MQKFSEWPIKVLLNGGLNKRNRGLEVIGLPVPFQIGGVTCSPSVTADALSSICAQPLFTTTIANRDIYLDSSVTNADDLVADGTILKPYKSFITAMNSIPRGLAHDITLYPAMGIYDGFPLYNNFLNLGGHLKIDASNVAVRTVTNLTGLTVLNKTTPNGLFDDSTVVTFLIEVSGSPFTNDSLCSFYARFNTGVSAGLMYPIISNDTDSFSIGGHPQSGLSIANGDEFDIVTTPVIITCHDQIIFNMNAPYSEQKVTDSFVSIPNLAMANCLFSWPNTCTYYGITFENASLDMRYVQFSKVMTPSNYGILVFFDNCDLNSYGPPFPTFYKNTLIASNLNIGIFVNTNGNSYPSVVDTLLYVSGFSYLNNICAPGCIININESSSYIVKSYSKYLYSSSSSVALLNTAFDNPLSVNAAIVISNTMLGLESIRIISAASAISIQEGLSSIVGKSLQQIPLTLTDDYAITMCGVSRLKIYLSASNLMGTVGAVKYLDGDHSTEATFPVAGTFVSDGAMCFVESDT
jgi:hypothetical protein